MYCFDTFFGQSSQINPNWHELLKQEKSSSLAPPRGIFYRTQWARHQKSLEIFDKKKVDKSDQKKKPGGGKCPSCQLGLRTVHTSTSSYLDSLVILWFYDSMILHLKFEIE